MNRKWYVVKREDFATQQNFFHELLQKMIIQFPNINKNRKFKT